ncbi:MAG: hypothetical protein ACFFB3_09045 [Candidatus Hodarchaeota archaeon]
MESTTEEFSDDDIIVMACVWDEAQGPVIISRSCAARHIRYDFSPIALNIYMSSLTVFGQTGRTQKAEFTVPLFTISPNHVVRVAFDGWEDSSVRGEIRTYFLAFIFPNSLNRAVNPYLDTSIWTHMQRIEEDRLDFSTDGSYEEILRVIEVSKSSIESFQTSYEEAFADYSIQNAVADLRNSSALWVRLQEGRSANFERDWLRVRTLSEKAAKKLQTVDYEGAGEAFFLLGNTEAKVERHQEAYAAFSSAADCFRKAVPPKFQKAGEALFNAAVSAFQNKDYGLAREALLTAVDWVTDVERLAELNFYLAKSLHELNVFDRANNHFEAAIQKAIEIDSYTIAVHFLSVYAESLESQSKLRAETSESYGQSLLELAASQRVRAAELLELMGSLVDAGLSLQMGVRYYVDAKNYQKALELSIQAIDLFERRRSFERAARAHIDAARLAYSLNNIVATLEHSEKAITILRKHSKLDGEKKDIFLGKALREQARAQEKQNSIREAIKSYKESIVHMETPESLTDLGSVQLALANLYYQLEFFAKAAKLFVDASKNLENKQRDLSLSNAYVCFKAASMACRQAGNIALMNENESEASRQFVQAVELATEAFSVSIGRKRNEALELLSEIKAQVQRKLSFFAESEELERLKDLLEETS